MSVPATLPADRGSIIEGALMTLEAKDVITRLHPDAQGCFIQLGDEKTGRFGGQMEARPKDRYFLLKLDHPNYSSLFQVAMHAAFLERRVMIRTRAEIDPEQVAEVDHLYVEFSDE
jgi:hypothetical protein